MAEQLPLVPLVPDGLREAARLGILIPFIGAGVSRVAGCPDWARFANDTLQWLIERGTFSYAQLDQIRHLNPRIKLSLARSLERENGVSIDYRKLLHPTNRKENIKGIRLYNSLFKLGKTFVTTNYDEWLDERLPQSALALNPDLTINQVSTVDSMRIIYKVDELLPSALSEPNTVIHLHGSLLDPPDMILTTQDYVRHYANDRMSNDPAKENRVLTFLEHLFRYKRVLFIGYGLDELEILEYVILKARPSSIHSKPEVKHHIIQGFYSHQMELVRSLQSYYLDCGLQLIPFRLDNKDWDQLLEVLEGFALQIPASEPLVLQKAQEMEELLNG
jgi:hypothetical protein